MSSNLQFIAKALSIDHEELKHVYVERVRNWNTYFEKWKSYKNEDQEEEFEVDDPDDWAVKGARDEDDNSSDGKDESIEEQCEEAPYNALELDFDKLRQTIRFAQNGIVLEEVEDLKCHNCGSRTYLPAEYAQDWDEEIFCNDCIIVQSGHENCEAPKCSTCIDIADLVHDRLNISQSFMDGTLAVLTQPALNISSEHSRVSDHAESKLVSCCNCGKETYWTEHEEMMCNDCMIEKSGHKDCMLPNCTVCIKIALTMGKRLPHHQQLLLKGFKLNTSMQLAPKKKHPNAAKLSLSCSSGTIKSRKKGLKSKAASNGGCEVSMIVMSPSSKLTSTPIKKRFSLCKRH